MSDTVTAVDYLNDQHKLEQEAKLALPYDPKECTYKLGELRQPVFACITCSKGEDKVGVCYSCLIQCHSTHTLVELFSKRNFVCDCGTTKTSSCCSLRSRATDRRPSISAEPVQINPEDIPSLSNVYNHNFTGHFCSCEQLYNPLEETGNMIQCYFGAACGEDWYHEDCILGYKHGLFSKKNTHSSENKLDGLGPPGEDALNDQEQNDADEGDVVEHFPSLDDFDLWICWKCAKEYHHIFEELENDDRIVHLKMPHFSDVGSADEWQLRYKAYIGENEEIPTKKRRVDIPYSIFLKNGFRSRMSELSKQDSKVGEFLRNNEYLYGEDPIYSPPPDDECSSTGSLLELGTEALLSLPREQAIEGIHAYDKIRSKLRDFFKPFAEEGKVVTEDKVREFFNTIKKDELAK